MRKSLSLDSLSHDLPLTSVVKQRRQNTARCAVLSNRNWEWMSRRTTYGTVFRVNSDPWARARRKLSALTHQSVKEVIQPQVPLRLPCYDFAPVTALAFGRLVLAVPTRTSGAHSFHGVTGGVYKARERIHRGVADPRLLAIPASWGQVAAPNPN